jgi:hypothetical protein
LISLPCPESFFRFSANDILKGKVKDILHVANVTIVEDSLEVNNGGDFTKERTFYKAHILKRGRDLV